MPITDREWEQVQDLIGRLLTQRTVWLLRRRGFTLLLTKDFRNGEDDMKLLDIRHDGGVLV